MSKIEINIKNVICASVKINEAKKEAASARMGIKGTMNFIDERIRSRNNLEGRLNQVRSQISRIEAHMEQIDSVVSNGANRYRTVDNQAVGQARELFRIEKRDVVTAGNEHWL